VPSIGVVIPSYNRAAFLPLTLNSILAQSRPPDEILVVDDGSTDNTQEILQAFSGNVRSIVIPNGGDLYARNVGMRNLQTELIAFCDSDDLWEAEFLETAIRFWSVMPELTACYANFRILQDGKLSSKTKLDDAPPFFLSGVEVVGGLGYVFTSEFVEALIGFQPLFPSCMVAHRERFLKVGGWDQGVSRIVGTDFATALRIACTPPVAIITEPLVQIRKHDGNFSADVEKVNFGDAEILEYVLRSRPAMQPKAPIFNRSIAQRRASGIDTAFARGDYRTFNKHYISLPWRFRMGKRGIKRLISLSLVFIGHRGKLK
jgi:glycosyltransferase involved in cell wall biosynthesis